MINLVNILKHCPEGTKLYSPLFGEVTFKGISSSNNILCRAIKYDGNITTVVFTRLGRGYCEFPSAECVLFPSKDQRDWNKFRVPQFKPFEKVLVRDNESLKWKCAFYSHFEPSCRYQHVVAGQSAYIMCIPFEGNEHLVGTTNNP